MRDFFSLLEVSAAGTSILKLASPEPRLKRISAEVGELRGALPKELMCNALHSAALVPARSPPDLIESGQDCSWRCAQRWQGKCYSLLM